MGIRVTVFVAYKYFELRARMELNRVLNKFVKIESKTFVSKSIAKVH
jgi:hypothetical protein